MAAVTITEWAKHKWDESSTNMLASCVQCGRGAAGRPSVSSFEAVDRYICRLEVKA